MKIVNLKSGDWHWPFTEAKVIDLVQKAEKNNNKKRFYVCITNNYPGLLGNSNMCFIPVGKARTEAEVAKEFVKDGGIASTMFPLFKLDKKMHDAELAGGEVPFEIVIVSSVPAVTNFFTVANTISMNPGVDVRNACDPYAFGSDGDCGVLSNFVAYAQYLLDRECGVEYDPNFDARVDKTVNRIIAESKKAEDVDEGANC